MSGDVLKYIEISEGLSVKIDEIEAVGYGNGDLTSKVYTHHNIYDSTFPYSVLVELLEANKEVDENEELKEIQSKQLNILKEIGTFAG